MIPLLPTAPSLPLLHFSGVPKGQFLESLRGQGGGTISRDRSATSLPCFPPLSPRPPLLCGPPPSTQPPASTPSLSQSQFPGIIAFSSWLPPSRQHDAGKPQPARPQEASAEWQETWGWEQHPNLTGPRQRGSWKGRGGRRTKTQRLWGLALGSAGAEFWSLLSLPGQSPRFPIRRAPQLPSSSSRRESTDSH